MEMIQGVYGLDTLELPEGYLHPGYVHVIPLADWIEHDAKDCVCGPEVEPVEREDGSYAWLITHHSLDGREVAQ